MRDFWRFLKSWYARLKLEKQAGSGIFVASGPKTSLFLKNGMQPQVGNLRKSWAQWRDLRTLIVDPHGWFGKRTRRTKSAPHWLSVIDQPTNDDMMICVHDNLSQVHPGSFFRDPLSGILSVRDSIINWNNYSWLAPMSRDSWKVKITVGYSWNSGANSRGLVLHILSINDSLVSEIWLKNNMIPFFFNKGCHART